MRIHRHVTPGHVELQRFEPEARGARLAAHGHEHAVGGQRELVGARAAHAHAVLRVVALHAAAQVQHHAALLQRVEHGLGQFLVVAGQHAFGRLDHGDFHAQLAVGHAQLQPDVARAHHDQAARQALGRQRAGGRDDRAAERQHGQLDRLGARGQQQVLAAHAHGLAAFGLHDHGLAVLDVRPALVHLHAGLAQERAHAAGEALDDAVLPAHGLRDVDAGLLHADAQRRAVGLVACSVERVRGVDQRLGRNAADVQAGAAQALALDQHGGNAELASADGSHIAAGTAADDQQLGGDFFHVYSSRFTRRTAGPGFRAARAWPG